MQRPGLSGMTRRRAASGRRARIPGCNTSRSGPAVVMEGRVGLDLGQVDRAGELGHVGERAPGRPAGAGDAGELGEIGDA